MDLLNLDYRKSVLKDIFSDENKSRKAESFKKSEIYNKRSAPYVNEKLKAEFPKTYKQMRKLFSINIAKRTTHKMASVYQRPPVRTLVDEAGKAITGSVQDFIEDVYKTGKINSKLQRANRVKRYQDQAIVQVLPLKGTIGMRVYQPHQIDIVPDPNDPEQAAVYITSAYDRSESISGGDGIDQITADRNDGENKKLENMRFVWWSKEYNFITNGKGEIVSGPDVLNPIQRHCFVNLADEQENEFWVRVGNAIIDFALEFSLVLSDTANVNRMQGYAQGVISDFKQPSEIELGPNNILFLKLDEGAPVQPSFEFVSPASDINASIKFLDQLLSYFLTSEGVDGKAISADGGSQRYSSALERFLSQVEAFEPSKEDLDLFQSAEDEVFEIIKAWANHFQGAANTPIKLSTASSIPDGAYIQVQFQEPELIQSPMEKQESAFKRLEKGIESPVTVTMEIKNLDEDGAVEYLKKVQKHQALLAPEEQANQTEAIPGQAPQTQAGGAAGGVGQSGSGSAEKVADSALNGAQVTAMIEIVAKVAAGEIPRESGVAIIEKAFLVPTSEADRVLGSAGKGFKPTEPEPKPSFGGGFKPGSDKGEAA